MTELATSATGDRLPHALRISHVAALVPDISATTAFLSELLAWGPWSIYELAEPRLGRRRFRGAPSQFRMIGAETHLHGIDFALNQSISGPSIYTEYIERRGYGLHHLACMTGLEEHDTLRQRFGENNIDVVMEGWIDDQIHFFYFDTEPALGVAVESGTGHAINLPPDRTQGPPPLEQLPGSLLGISFVVDALADAATSFTRLLGWGPWHPDPHVLEHDSGLVSTLRSTHTQVKPVEVSLLHPFDTNSFEGQVLAKSGAGLCYLSCALPLADQARVETVLSSYGLLPVLRVNEMGCQAWYVNSVPRLKLVFQDLRNTGRADVTEFRQG